MLTMTAASGEAAQQYEQKDPNHYPNTVALQKLDHFYLPHTYYFTT